MNAFVRSSACAIALLAAVPAFGQTVFELTSPAFGAGGTLPADLKCVRAGGDGASPPLAWTTPPDGTQSLALEMRHYPRGTVEGLDTPSQYWLLWNIPPDATAIPRGNPASLGDEGSDKDGRRTGYTPPCSPGSESHEYTITLYALSAPLDDLPEGDDRSVDWTRFIEAMEGKVIDAASLSFVN